MRTKIKKAKLKDRSLIVDLEEYIDVEGAGTVTNEVTKSCGNLVHDDLVNAFDNLKKHLVCICDMKGSDLINNLNIEDFDLELLKEYNVSGFTVGGNDDSEGATLIGNRTFKSGKVLNIVSPFTKFNDENDPYKFASELVEDIERCKYEVEEYVFNNKCAVKQLEMDFEGEVDKGYTVSVMSGDQSFSEALEEVVSRKLRKSSGRKKNVEQSEEAA